ncbi:hypothetical protein [uncultured Desulfobacter sp.]|uniref:hypothetical protein n=1 Tax=uncultured Desulfobacter sp. TaxID=240139 RepID=UPI0029F511F0|nr:hypothetical protein [uncultured Desulfobacter sp.]
MYFSPSLASPVTHTHMQTPRHVAGISGMCAACTADCTGPCEIGLSAIRGAEAILPFAADKNQFASEKEYPLDFSHFNINGRVFGAKGASPDPDKACFPYIDREDIVPLTDIAAEATGLATYKERTQSILSV